MSHEVESMFYVNERPWHGLGIPLLEPPSIDDAIRIAGLDWNVELEPVFLKDGTRVKNKFAVVRESDRRVFGIVGPSWRPLQNVDAFKFFQTFIDSGEVVLETAGSLRGGRRVWILAKMRGSTLDVVKDDAVEPFFMLSNAHMGGVAVIVGFTPIRIVCANTLAMAERPGASRVLRVVHSPNVAASMDVVRETIDMTKKKFVATVEQYIRLTKSSVMEGDITKYVTKVFFAPEAKPSDRAIKNAVERIRPKFESGRGNDLPSIKGTWWALYNGVAEHLAYDRGNSRDVRTESLWFGAGQDINKRALDVALEMA